MAHNTDANYKSGSNKKEWKNQIYKIDPTDNIQGSQGIELINPSYLNDPFGFDDKAHVDLINILGNLNIAKSVIIIGEGDPNIELNKHFDQYDAINSWWGYRRRIDDYGTFLGSDFGFNYPHPPAPGKTFGDILVEGNGGIYSKDGYTITELAENRGNSFGITADNYTNILYLDITDYDNQKGSILNLWRVSSLGSSTITRYLPNTIGTWPDVVGIQSLTTIDWLGNIITDPDWENDFNRTPKVLNENLVESTESIVLYTEPIWSQVAGMYVNTLKLQNVDETGRFIELISTPSDGLEVRNESVSLGTIKLNKITANAIDATSLNQMQIVDNEMLVNSENEEVGDGRYSVNRIDEDNVSLKYEKDTDEFSLKDESDNLLNLKVKKLLIDGQEDLEYDADVIITNQTEFDTTFNGTTFDDTGSPNKIQINPGNYTLNNDIIISKSYIYIRSLKGAIIKMGDTTKISKPSYVSDEILYPINYTSLYDANLTGPNNTFDTQSNLIPMTANNNIFLNVQGSGWISPIVSGTPTTGVYTGNVSGYSGVSFQDAGGGNWFNFADGNIYNGLQRIYLPKNATGDILGGYIDFYYNETAWRYAFYNQAASSNYAVIAQNGSVYKGSISNSNLVVRWDGQIGPAGSATPDVIEDISTAFNNIKLDLNIIGPDTGDNHTDLIDLTNIINSEINLTVDSINADNIIKNGDKNKINIYVGENGVFNNNIFESTNTYITGELRTDTTGDKIFNNCTNLVVRCTIDDQKIMGTGNYDF